MKQINIMNLMLGLFLISVMSTALFAMQQTIRTDGMSQQIAVSMNVIPNQLKRGSVQPQLVSDQLESVKHEISDWSLNPKNWFSKKIIFCAAATVLASYLWLCHECVQTNNFFRNPENWLSWHSDWPYQVIISMPKEQLARDLWAEIQQRYVLVQNPNDSPEMIIAFTADIDREIARLAHYAKIVSMVRWINLPFIFPLDSQVMNQIEISSKRLVYIKQVVLSHAQDNILLCCTRGNLVPAFGD